MDDSSACANVAGVQAQDEYVVLVDDAGQPVGRELKARVHHADTPLHLAFSIFLFDEDGHTLLQQRAARKATWPGFWSNTCCGHPAPGESLSDAAARRLRQELGIEQPPPLLLALPHFRYRARWGTLWENEICPVLVGFYRGAVRPDPEEVAATRWTPWMDLVRASAAEPSPVAEVYSPWSRWEAAALHRLPAFAHGTLRA